MCQLLNTILTSYNKLMKIIVLLPINVCFLIGIYLYYIPKWPAILWDSCSNTYELKWVSFSLYIIDGIISERRVAYMTNVFSTKTQTNDPSYKNQFFNFPIARTLTRNRFHAS